jgi:hypothetical protein
MKKMLFVLLDLCPNLNEKMSFVLLDLCANLNEKSMCQIFAAPKNQNAIGGKQKLICRA